MPIDLPTLAAALLSGLLGGLHCAAMCGGIAAAIAAGAGRAPPLCTALLSNLGRVGGYVLAGALAGGLGAGLLTLARIESAVLAMRMAVGAVLILVALRLLGLGGRLGFVSAPGNAIWRALAPLHRRLLPADTAPRQLLAGALWGWLPCGLSGSLLIAAWLSADAIQGAQIMAAFGLGTLPLMVSLTWSGARVLRWLQRPGARYGAAGLIGLSGLLTLSAPWLARLPAAHAWLQALGCRTLPS